MIITFLSNLRMVPKMTYKYIRERAIFASWYSTDVSDFSFSLETVWFKCISIMDVHMESSDIFI
jgi:hypothetical protein